MVVEFVHNISTLCTLVSWLLLLLINNLWVKFPLLCGNSSFLWLTQDASFPLCILINKMVFSLYPVLRSLDLLSWEIMSFIRTEIVPSLSFSNIFLPSFVMFQILSMLYLPTQLLHLFILPSLCSYYILGHFRGKLPVTNSSSLNSIEVQFHYYIHWVVHLYDYTFYLFSKIERNTPTLIYLMKR